MVTFFPVFSWFASLVIMIRALIFDLFTPRFYPYPTSFSPLLCSKLSAFLAKSGSPLGCPVGTKRGLKMVENTSKMMLRASKIDQGMAKIITQKIERILKKNHLCGFCYLDFATLCFCYFAFFKGGCRNAHCDDVEWRKRPCTSQQGVLPLILHYESERVYFTRQIQQSVCALYNTQRGGQLTPSKC